MNESKLHTYKLTITAGLLQGKIKADEMVLYMKGKDEVDIKRQFYKNVVNLYYRREIIKIEMQMS